MNEFVGLTISAVRPMTVKEIEAEGWRGSRNSLAMVIVLSDKTKIYASKDPEGNGPGVLFGRKGRSQFMLGYKVK